MSDFSDPTVHVPECYTPDTDPYLGLLSEPPGLWSITHYGSAGHKMLVVQGSPEFLIKARHLCSSFAGSHIRHELAVDTWAIPITETRMLRAIELYLWSRLVKRKGQIEEVLDDEGGVLDVYILNDEALAVEARDLANVFYTKVLMTTPLPMDPCPDNTSAGIIVASVSLSGDGRSIPLDTDEDLHHFRDSPSHPSSHEDQSAA